MSMSNNQEVNVHLAKTLSWEQEEKEAKDILVLIDGTCIIRLNI